MKNITLKENKMKKEDLKQIIKKNKTKMKKSVLKEIIKKEIFNILKEEEDTPTKVTIPSTLIQLIKDLGNDDNLPTLQQAFAKIKIGEDDLSPPQNKELADTFIALMKNNDITKFNRLVTIFRQIK
jgi:hypothetical protein